MQNNKRLYLYVIFSHTATGVGRLIRLITRNPYNHMSVALNPDLSELYSFARIRLNTPLVGGFIRETPLRFSAGTTREVRIKLCAIPLSEIDYKRVYDFIDGFRHTKDPTMYDLFSAGLHILHIGYELPRAHTCMSFCVKVLQSAGVLDESRVCHAYTIRSLENKFSENVIFEGAPLDYPDAGEWREDDFFTPAPLRHAITGSIQHFFRLCRHAFTAGKR